MKNWKTSLCGIVAAVAGFIAMHPRYTSQWPFINDLAGYVMIGGLAGIGIAAKDSTTHSTEAQVEKASLPKP